MVTENPKASENFGRIQRMDHEDGGEGGDCESHQKLLGGSLQ